MSERQLFPLQKQHENGTETHAIEDAAKGRWPRWPKIWSLLLLTLLSLGILLYGGLRSQRQQPAVQKTVPGAAFLTPGAFHDYPFPKPDTQPMRPAIDHQGRIWFGAMGQNALVVFDPRMQTFRYLVPPHGHHGIMGVLVAPDDTIWFAEQFANYLGHYFPVTDRYALYPLPWLTVPDPVHTGQRALLPSAPNELVLDAQGEVWFTELNADRLGRLNPVTGLLRQYPLMAKASIQTLYPYGITIDSHGILWFTESGTSQFGCLDPVTGTFRFFRAPDPHALLMEITSDVQGSIWITSFTPGLLFRFRPAVDTFTSYLVPAQGSQRSTLYGLLVTSPDTVWVTMLEANALARLDTATRRFHSYALPTPDTQPLGLVMDASQALWFTGINAVGMVRPERAEKR